MGSKILLLLALGAVFYLLYAHGYMVTSAKTAAMFVGRFGGNRGCRVKFSRCSGFVRRVVRFKESGSCSFALNARLTEGECSVEILDGAKQTVLTLSPDAPRGSVTVERGRRYYLTFRFFSASGELELRWE